MDLNQKKRQENQLKKMIKQKKMNLSAIPFDVIIKDIIYQSNQNKKQPMEFSNKIKQPTPKQKNNIEFRNIINIIYNKKNNWYSNRILGKEFVKNNKNNITLIINGKESELVVKFNLKKGMNNIQMKINNKLTNLNSMFRNSESLENIEELKYLNTENVNDFSYIFYWCS